MGKFDLELMSAEATGAGVVRQRVDRSVTFSGEAIRSDITIVVAHADHFRKTDWPGSSRPSVFYHPRALDPEGPGGILHAKAVVADDEAFITSANLTEAA